MQKTIRPQISKHFVSNHIQQFVHCDQKVLHAPGEYQVLRQASRMASITYCVGYCLHGMGTRNRRVALSGVVCSRRELSEMEWEHTSTKNRRVCVLCRL